MGDPTSTLYHKHPAGKDRCDPFRQMRVDGAMGRIENLYSSFGDLSHIHVQEGPFAYRDTKIGRINKTGSRVANGAF